MIIIVVEKFKMSSGGAYGAGKAGVSFDPLVFFQRPQVIIRIISWVRSLLFLSYKFIWAHR